MDQSPTKEGDHIPFFIRTSEHAQPRILLLVFLDDGTRIEATAGDRIGKIATPRLSTKQIRQVVMVDLEFPGPMY